MKVLYYIPSLETVYAARFIYEGYKDAFLALGHEFETFTAGEDLSKALDEFKPDIFISSLNRYTIKFLDLELLKKKSEEGLVRFTQISPWKKQNNMYAGSGVSEDPLLAGIIKSGLGGDIYFHWLEQDDPAMEGFTEDTGYKFETILLAANKNKYFYEYDEKYKSDISYVGSYLPSKRRFLKKHLIPLMKKYDVKVYGSDWTLADRLSGHVQKIGQFLNIDLLKKVRKLKLPIEDERKVYSSSTISLNIHEEHQRLFGSDFNERTFKIIASGGFEICDNVKALRKYFDETELVIAENTQDWFDKIDYYLKNPEERTSIIEAGRKKVLSEHTYENRVRQIEKIYGDFRGMN